MILEAFSSPIMIHNLKYVFFDLHSIFNTKLILRSSCTNWREYVTWERGREREKQCEKKTKITEAALKLGQLPKFVLPRFFRRHASRFQCTDFCWLCCGQHAACQRKHNCARCIKCQTLELGRDDGRGAERRGEITGKHGYLHGTLWSRKQLFQPMTDLLAAEEVRSQNIRSGRDRQDKEAEMRSARRKKWRGNRLELRILNSSSVTKCEGAGGNGEMKKLEREVRDLVKDKATRGRNVSNIYTRMHVIFLIFNIRLAV